MIKKIGRRKLKEKLNGLSQQRLFEEVRESREHICEVCGKHILEPKAFCFAHMLNKNNYPKYKFDENNIALVCSMECHYELDKILVGKKPHIEALLSIGEKFSLDDLD